MSMFDEVFGPGPFSPPTEAPRELVDLKKLVERGSSYVVCEGKLYLVTVKPARAVVDEETKSV